MHSRPRAAPISGPFYPLLRSPELMTRTRAMGDYLRYKSALPPRLSEFVILLTAREWTQQYEWNAHYPIAVKAGVKREILDAIAEGRRPSAMSDEDNPVRLLPGAASRQGRERCHLRARLEGVRRAGRRRHDRHHRVLHAAGDDAEHRAHAGRRQRQPRPAADPEITRVMIFRSQQPKDPR